MRPRSTGHASGRPTDYAIVTCDRYSAPQHDRLDCCSPAAVTGPHPFDVKNSALLTAPFTIGMCWPTAAVDQVIYSATLVSCLTLHDVTRHHQTKCNSSLNADANVKPLYDFLSVINHKRFNSHECSNKTASSIKIEIK